MVSLPDTSEPPEQPRSLRLLGPSQKPFLPLTEWILARLPGPRAAWLVVWIALPVVYLALPLTFNLERSDAQSTGARSEALIATVYVYALALSLWAARRMAHDAASIESRLATLRPGRAAFRQVDSRMAPLAITMAVSAVGVTAASLTADSATPLLLLPLPFLINLPLMTALWTYLAVLIGLDRLGRRKLNLDDAFPADTVLGLGPIGTLAFRVFLVFVAGFVPVLVVSFVNPAFLILDLVLFVPGVALFVLSLYRLHLQMAATRHRHVERARALYVAAYAPHWESGDPAGVRRDAGLLLAVAEMERRAASISTWPFQPGTRAVILTLVVGLSVTLAGRLISFAVGL
jgi:hypothetical protein